MSNAGFNIISANDLMAMDFEQEYEVVTNKDTVVCTDDYLGVFFKTSILDPQNYLDPTKKDTVDILECKKRLKDKIFNLMFEVDLESDINGIEDVIFDVMYSPDESEYDDVTTLMSYFNALEDQGLLVHD